jgi:hypothetical protein
MSLLTSRSEELSTFSQMFDHASPFLASRQPTTTSTLSSFARTRKENIRGLSMKSSMESFNLSSLSHGKLQNVWRDMPSTMLRALVATESRLFTRPTSCECFDLFSGRWLMILLQENVRWNVPQRLSTSCKGLSQDQVRRRPFGSCLPSGLFTRVDESLSC